MYYLLFYRFSTYDCDYFWPDFHVRVTHVGGDTRVGDLMGGPFYLYYRWDASLKAWQFSACLMIVIILLPVHYLYRTHTAEALLCMI